MRAFLSVIQAQMLSHTTWALSREATHIAWSQHAAILLLTGDTELGDGLSLK
jgi:hypothetical protein